MLRLIYLFIISFLFAHGNVTAGGWPKPKGSFYIKLSQWWIIYDQYYNEHGKILNDRTRSIGHTSIYTEYALSNHFTVLSYIPFFSKATLFEQVNTHSGNIVEQGDKITSIGDAELSLKYNLLKGNDVPFNISLSTILGIPLGEDSGGYDGSLQTGDGEFNQMLRVDVSGSLKIGDRYPYYSIFAAVNNRTQGFSDDYRFGLEAGLELSFITALCKVRSVNSFNNGSFNNDLVGTNIAGNNTEFIMIEPEIIIRFGHHVGVSFTYSKPVYGKLIFSESSYTIGLSFKNNK